ncbi:MAG: hypothetical protein VW378_07420 [bacterium]
MECLSKADVALCYAVRLKQLNMISQASKSHLDDRQRRQVFERKCYPMAKITGTKGNTRLAYGLIA